MVSPHALCLLTDPDASPCGPAWYDMSPPLENCSDLSFQWQSSSNLLASPHLKNEDVCKLSHVQLFVTSWTVIHQTPLSVEFSKQEDWSGLPFPSPRDLPGRGIKPMSPALADGFFITEPLLTSLFPNYFFKGQISKCSHI